MYDIYFQVLLHFTSFLQCLKWWSHQETSGSRGSKAQPKIKTLLALFQGIYTSHPYTQQSSQHVFSCATNRGLFFCTLLRDCGWTNHSKTSTLQRNNKIHQCTTLITDIKSKYNCFIKKINLWNDSLNPCSGVYMHFTYKQKASKAEAF